MLRSPLSPSSAAQCNYLGVPSPSHKHSQMNTMFESSSTVASSQLQQSDCLHNKFYSFKKIKQERVNQKNNQGRVVKQMVYRPTPARCHRLKTLDDAKTISSRNSVRDSFSLGKPVIEESIILVRGRDFDAQLLAKSAVSDTQSPKPSTQTTQALHVQQPRSDLLRHVSISPPLVRSVQTGLVFNYELSVNCAYSLERAKLITADGVLRMYAYFPLQTRAGSEVIELYEPYTELLVENLLRSETISFKAIVQRMLELIKILSRLRDVLIYPEINPACVVLCNEAVKIKVNPSQRPLSELQVLRQYAFYFTSVFAALMSGCAPTPSSTSRKITGLTIKGRLQFENLMQELASAADCSFGEAYLKIQLLGC